MRSARHENFDCVLPPPSHPRPAATRAALRTPALACRRSAVREREREEREKSGTQSQASSETLYVMNRLCCAVCDASSVIHRMRDVARDTSLEIPRQRFIITSAEFHHHPHPFSLALPSAPPPTSFPLDPQPSPRPLVAQRVNR